MDYKTIQARAQGEFVERKSRFIGTTMPVQTEEQAQSFIQSVSKAQYDATHNVYAYILREGQIRRYSDNGEPQGTAGIPALDVLQKEGLCDLCVVVTRYFGGILLGGGGLVRAYSHAVKLAVDAAKILQMTLCEQIAIACDYAFYGKLTHLLPTHDAVVLESEFGAEVTLKLLLRKDGYAGFCKDLTALSNGQVEPHILGERYYAF